MWSSHLDLTVLLEEAIRKATCHFLSLAGLAASNALPLCCLIKMFESRVEGSMRFGRWLYALSPTARSVLDHAYTKWAQILLGADAWRN